MERVMALATLGDLARYVLYKLDARLFTDACSALTTDELVSLYVDGVMEPYKVQRSLLTQASPWFVKALDERFQEGQNLKLEFPDTKQETLEFFLRWLFKPTEPWPPYKLSEMSRQLLHDQQLAAVRLWIFADKHFIPALQDVAMRNLFEFLRSAYPQIDTVYEAYENSQSTSPLRKIMMTNLLRGLKSKANEGEGFTADEVEVLKNIQGFTSDLAKQLMVVVQWADLRVSNTDVKEYLVNEKGGQDKTDPPHALYRQEDMGLKAAIFYPDDDLDV